MSELLCFIRVYTNKTKGNKFAKCVTTPDILIQDFKNPDKDVKECLNKGFDPLALPAPNKCWTIKPCQGEPTIPLREGVYKIDFTEGWEDTREEMVQKGIIRVKGVTFTFVKDFESDSVDHK